MELLSDILQRKLKELNEAEEDYREAKKKNIAGSDKNYVKRKYEELNVEGEEWSYEKGLQEDALIDFSHNYERIMIEIKEKRKNYKKKEEEIKNMKLEDFNSYEFDYDYACDYNLEMLSRI